LLLVAGCLVVAVRGMRYAVRGENTEYRPDNYREPNTFFMSVLRLFFLVIH